MHLLFFCVIYEQRHFATNRTSAVICHIQRQNGSRSRSGGIAACRKDLYSRRDGTRTPCRHNSRLTLGLPTYVPCFNLHTYTHFLCALHHNMTKQLCLLVPLGL
jgi:hypothetical protein